MIYALFLFIVVEKNSRLSLAQRAFLITLPAEHRQSSLLMVASRLRWVFLYFQWKLFIEQPKWLFNSENKNEKKKYSAKHFQS